ncbi:MAG: B12-binding domain-containing radical SAM protein [Planctomycetes bacterium]|nr:B12-binding domain-containing radical SAM protein [Planctomycetota bacterium]
MTRALLIHPEFRVASFWNYRETCELVGAKYPAAPLGLCTVAAMLPKDWEVRLIDRNVEKWDPKVLDWADIVMMGGMLPQQLDALEMISEARKRGKVVVVGGPDATSSPHVYKEASHLVLGEAEVTLPKFLAEFAAGTAQPIYIDAAKANMHASPTPRFDLLKFDAYNHVGIQWCRGCPFLCEFCDIIELFGRVPRTKNHDQILAELQSLYDLGYRGHVDLVDDNFIGNKKLAKEFLPLLKVWLEERNWPFEFTTEASINLADDEELMQKMQDTGFFAVFVGIESPDEATLIAMKKKQNTGRSIAESIHTITKHGMWVNAGFILGCDGEKGSVAKGIIDCIEDTGIPVNMAGLMFALPSTQLTRRLRKEGRLHENYELATSTEGDQCTAGLNFDPLRPRADILRDYLKVIQVTYAPAAYFGRVRKVAKMMDSSKRRYKPSAHQLWKETKAFFKMVWKLGLKPSTGYQFFRTFLGTLLTNPSSIRYVGSLCALYIHFGPFSRFIVDRIGKSIAIAEQEDRVKGVPKPAPVVPAAHGHDHASPPAATAVETPGAVQV